MQHALYSVETTSTICAAALGIGITPLVRVPSHEARWMSRVLNGGVQGVIVPDVNTHAQAGAIVNACRFPPLGKRSVMGLRPALGYRAVPLAELNPKLNTEMAVIVMLETAEGVENCEAIAAVDGVDVLLIGSGDLTTDLGIPGQVDHPQLRTAYERVAAASIASRLRLPAWNRQAVGSSTTTRFLQIDRKRARPHRRGYNCDRASLPDNSAGRRRLFGARPATRPRSHSALCRRTPLPTETHAAPHPARRPRGAMSRPRVRRVRSEPRVAESGSRVASPHGAASPRNRREYRALPVVHTACASRCRSRNRRKSDPHPISVMSTRPRLRPGTSVACSPPPAIAPLPASFPRAW